MECEGAGIAPVAVPVNVLGHPRRQWHATIVTLSGHELRIRGSAT